MQHVLQSMYNRPPFRTKGLTPFVENFHKGTIVTGSIYSNMEIQRISDREV